MYKSFGLFIINPEVVMIFFNYIHYDKPKENIPLPTTPAPPKEGN